MAGRHKIFLGMAAGRRQDLPDAPGGPGRGGGRPRRRDRLPRDARARGDRGAGRGPRGDSAPPRRRTAARRWRRWTCPAILARAPELCLIDELAHTNAPGLEHAKRYEDVDDVLEAGIDVFSTVNVQHLESLNDQVAELTRRARARDVPRRGARQRRRGRAHRPHAGGADRAPARGQGLPGRARADAALNGFFRIENLAALREVALRQVAEDVEAKRLVRERAAGRARTALMAAPRRRRSASGCSRSSRRTPRAAARRAARLALGAAARRRARRPVVLPPGRAPNADEREQLDALRRLALACSARTCSSRRATTSPRSPPRRPRARHDLRADRRRRRRARGLRRVCASRCRSGSCARCRASTCGSWPTASQAGLERDRSTSASLLVAVARRVAGALAFVRRVRAPTRRAGAARAGARRAHPASRSSAASCPSARSQAALRLARAEHATLVPAYLATVPRRCRSTRRSARTATSALRCFEAIEQRAARAGVPVDAPHRARAQRPPRAARAARGRARRPSSWPRPARATTASASTTSPGCCATPRGGDRAPSDPPAPATVHRPGRTRRRTRTREAATGARSPGVPDEHGLGLELDPERLAHARRDLARERHRGRRSSRRRGWSARACACPRSPTAAGSP